MNASLLSTYRERFLVVGLGKPQQFFMKGQMMRTLFYHFGLIASLLIFCSFATVVAQTQKTYTVGGDDADYATLEELRTSGVLRSGDTVVLNGDDRSLTGSLSGYGLIFQGTGKISPAGAPFRLLVNNNGNNTIDSDSLEFSGFAGGAYTNGAILQGNTTINGGTNTFSNNTGLYGAVLGGSGTHFLNGGINSFFNNTSSYGGAIYGNATINEGTNTFSDNTSLSGGGAAIAGNTIIINGGTNTFSNNTARTGGGAIRGNTAINITGGTNSFFGNNGGNDGGALSGNISIVGGTNTFTDNTSNVGGAIFNNVGEVVLRATDGNFTFQGNRDRVGTASEKANAIHMNNTTVGAHSTLTLAAEEGQNIYFYDPVTSNVINGVQNSLTISINDQSTDKGSVVFDGSLYTREVDRHSAVYGNTTVGSGSMVLNGSAIYGASATVGSFTLNEWATLESGVGTNEIRANQINLHGTVDIARGGILTLASNNDVNFDGLMNIGLGAESYGSVIGNLTFGEGARLNVSWDDNLADVYDGWSNEYNLFGASSVTDWDNLLFEQSRINTVGGWFTPTWHEGMLTLTYTADVPEPATLVMLGLGLAGLGWARRRRK